MREGLLKNSLSNDLENEGAQRRKWQISLD